MRFSSSRWLCLLLMVAVAAVGIAIFSPLHKHERNSSTKCSLGNIDAQQTDGPTVVCELPRLERSIENLRLIERATITAATLPSLPARAPPALS